MKRSIFVFLFLIFGFVKMGYSLPIYPDKNIPGTKTYGIQEAIDGCSQPGGCEIILDCAKEYVLTPSENGSIVFDGKKNIVLRGCGESSSVLKPVGDTSEFSSKVINIKNGSENIFLSGFTIDIDTPCTEFCSKDLGDSGIYISSDSKNVYINNVFFSSSSNDISNFTTSLDVNSGFVFIRNNTFNTSGGGDISLKLNGSGNFSDIIGNYFYMSGEQGDKVAINNSGFSNSKIEQNSFNCADGSICKGIVFEDNVNCETCSHGNIISSNIFENFGPSGRCPFLFNISNDDNKYNLVSGNVINLVDDSMNGFCGDPNAYLTNCIKDNLVLWYKNTGTSPTPEPEPTPEPTPEPEPEPIPEPVPSIIKVYVELENTAINIPWKIETSSESSNGKYVVVPNGVGFNNSPDNPLSDKVGELVYNINIPKQDKYYVWIRMNTVPYDDSFWMSVNGGVFERTNDIITNGWEWKKLDYHTVDLGQGNLQIKIRNREDGTKLDSLFLTNDVATTP